MGEVRMRSTLVPELFDWLETVFAFWRFYLALTIGVLAGLAVFYLGKQDPSAAAVAFVLGMLGACFGVVWEAAHRSSR